MSQTKAQLLEPTGVFTLTNQLVGVGATFSGDVSIGGTLTKQDVTNVDSVGVITARSDIIVGGNIAHLGDTDTKIAFTNNQIDFQANNSSRLYVNQYATYLQTAYPLAFLSSSGASPSIKSGGTNNQDLLLTTGTSNPTRIHIKSDGKIGIGTNNPSSQLDLSGTNTTVWPFTSDVSNVYAYSPYPHELQIQNHARDVTGAFAGIYFHSGASADGSYVSAARIAAIDSGNYKSDLAFGTRNTAFKERLRITADGKVGIGTINPTRGPLHVHENSTGDVQIHLTNQETGTTSSDGFTVFAGGNAGPNAGFVNRESGGTIAFYTHNGSSVGVRLTISQTGNLTSTGTIADSKGDVRSIPSVVKNSQHALVASDAGKALLSTSGGLVVNNSVMSAGDAVTFINSSGSDMTITQGSGVTINNTADASTGNRTLAGKGMATLWFSGADTAYISGSGLS